MDRVCNYAQVLLHVRTGIVPNCSPALSGNWHFLLRIRQRVSA
jgi:hypothetical protein